MYPPPKKDPSMLYDFEVIVDPPASVPPSFSAVESFLSTPPLMRLALDSTDGYEA